MSAPSTVALMQINETNSSRYNEQMREHGYHLRELPATNIPFLTMEGY